MKTPPSRYRATPGPVRRRPRWGLFLACLPLSGLLLGFLVCALMGISIALVWLTAPPEISKATRVRRLQPLLLPTVTPTFLPSPVTGPGANQIEPVEPASPPPVTTSDPAPITPTPTVDGSQTLAEITVPAPPPSPAPSSTTIPLPTITPTPIPTPTASESIAPVDTPPAVPIPDSWKDYMKRNSKSG